MNAEIFLVVTRAGTCPIVLGSWTSAASFKWGERGRASEGARWWMCFGTAVNVRTRVNMCECVSDVYGCLCCQSHSNPQINLPLNLFFWHFDINEINFVVCSPASLLTKLMVGRSKCRRCETGGLPHSLHCDHTDAYYPADVCICIYIYLFIV